MIIDGHAYSFPPMKSTAGYASLEEKMRVVQRELGGHHQPAWRVGDRARVNNDTLVDPETSQLRDVSWGYNRYGYTWSYQGESYTKQYFPPMLHDMECPPELLIAEMDYIGVDKAVLHTSPHLGLLNDYLRQVVSRYPSRFMRLINLPESAIPGDPDAAIAELQREAEAGDHYGIQYFTKPYYDSGLDVPWDDGPMRPYWEAVASLKAPVYFTLGPTSRAGERDTSAEQPAYLEQHRHLLRWMERYPDVPVVITHGLAWRTFLEGNRIRFPEEIWDVFKAPQCHLQLLFQIQLGAIWEYPWKETEPTIQECLEKVGAERLIWGTDLPMVARFCTYRQLLDQYRVHCEFLTDAERSAILGGNVARVMGLDT